LRWQILAQVVLGMLQQGATVIPGGGVSQVNSSTGGVVTLIVTGMWQICVDLESPVVHVLREAWIVSRVALAKLLVCSY
jgi:hypothetical protein